jgi:hypothetical protein
MERQGWLRRFPPRNYHEDLPSSPQTTKGSWAGVARFLTYGVHRLRIALRCSAPTPNKK